MYKFPEPIADDACTMCEGEARGWTAWETRTRTLCGFHYQEWAYEKTCNDY